MTDCIQYDFAHSRFVEGWDIPYKQTILKVLSIIPKVDEVPYLFIEGEKTLTEFLPVLCRTGSVAGAVFKNHLSLRKKSPQSFFFSEENQGGIRYSLVYEQFRIG
jgi:hypothetical protein